MSGSLIKFNYCIPTTTSIPLRKADRENKFRYGRMWLWPSFKHLWNTRRERYHTWKLSLLSLFFHVKCFISPNILGRWESLQLGQTVRLSGRRIHRPRQCQPAVMEVVVPTPHGPVIDSSARAQRQEFYVRDRARWSGEPRCSLFPRLRLYFLLQLSYVRCKCDLLYIGTKNSRLIVWTWTILWNEWKKKEIKGRRNCRLKETI